MPHKDFALGFGDIVGKLAIGTEVTIIEQNGVSQQPFTAKVKAVGGVPGYASWSALVRGYTLIDAKKREWFTALTDQGTNANGGIAYAQRIK